MGNMEFKSINKLTISDCCAALSISRDLLKPHIVVANNEVSSLYEKVFEGKALSGIKEEIAQKLISLIHEDRIQFLQCKTLQEFEQYLSTNNEGLWCAEAQKKIKDFKGEQEEKEYYIRNKNSIEGIERYLHKYPHGLYSLSARKLLSEKKKIRGIKRISTTTFIIIMAYIICYLNYSPSSYISSDSNVAFSKKGGISTCNISTDAKNDNIQVYVAEEWIKATFENGILNIKVLPNHGESRIGTISLYAYTTLFGFNLWKEEHDISVLQNSGLSTFLTISNSYFSFDKYGTGEAECSVETDGMNLDISSDDEWIILKKNISEQGDNFMARLVITAKTNESGERTGIVMVKCDNFNRQISIKQNSGLATYFNVSPNSLVMGEEGTEEGYYYPIEVNTDGTTWSVSNAPDWLSTEAKVLKGRLHVTLPENNGKIKTGTITIISNNGDSRDISVKQMGDPTDFNASSSTVRFGTSSDYEFIGISNNSEKNIYVSDDENWLGAIVINRSKIKVYCSQNNSSPRSGSVRITCGHEEISITVKQDGWTECSNCGGNGHVNCNNYQAQWRYYPYYNSNYHQVYQVTGQYYSFGTWLPRYEWINCPTCGGDGKIDCSRCGTKGKIQKSY